MRIKQFRYSSDNMSYLIISRDECAVIDGGAVDSVMNLIDKKGLKLKYALNTHGHSDHTPGNELLLKTYSSVHIKCRKLADMGKIKVGDEDVTVFATPGHTEDSITFHLKEDGVDALITGDTVFNGTIGNCFSGDLKGFKESVKKVLSFPDSTKIYAGHDYVKESIAFARTIDPDNDYFAEYMKKYDRKLVVSTLYDEKRINPYLRFNDPSMIAIMKKRKLKVETEDDRWNSIMHLY